MPPTPPHPRKPATALIAGLVIAALCITTVAIVLSRRVPAPKFVSNDDIQRQWDAAHHDQVVAIKREAEALTLEGNFRESHIKYARLDELLGKRRVKDPVLAEIVAAAREDQASVYKLMLQQMERQGETSDAPAPATGALARAATTAPATILVPAAAADAAKAQAATTQPVAQAAPALAPAPVSPAAPVTPAAPPSLATSRPTQAVAGAASLPASQPAFAIIPGEVPRGAISDADVGLSIQLGVDYLLGQIDENGALRPAEEGRTRRDDGGGDLRQNGLNALCVYALAAAERAIRDPRLSPKGAQMDRMLEQLKAFDLGTNRVAHGPATYARSLRACALATFNRPQDRATLADDVDWLINANSGGAYTYDDRFAPPRRNRPPVRKPATTRATRPAPRADASGGANADVDRYARTRGDAGFIADVDRSIRLRGDADVESGADAHDPGHPDAGAGAHQRRDTGVRENLVLLAPAPPGAAPPAAAERPRVPNVFTDPPAGAGDEPRRPPARITPPPNRSSEWDNSNSQYGLLGVWAGADVGIEVPENYWRLVQRHWSSCQFPSGEWGYSARSSSGYFAMTVAGVASLLVTHDNLEAPLLATRRSFNRDPYPPALTAGLRWLAEGNNSMKVESQPYMFVGYNLFGLERVALASGFKQFGKHDWFVELGADVIAGQNPDGSFGPEPKNRLIETAYALLFLSRGRHPILMNKLRFDDYWTNRPREIANLANFVGKELERPINWQVVDVDRDADDWADAPIVFIASHKTPKFDDPAVAKLRAYVENGGVLFTHADLGSEEFNRAVAELAKKLFPQYPLVELPLEHPLYTINYTVKSPRPRLMGVSNGSRLLLIHAPTDLSNAWQTRALVSRRDLHEMGINIYLYATGKQRYRNRLDSTVVPEPSADAPAHVVSLARVRYAGNWDPEPGAWPRMARKLKWETGVKLTVTPTEAANLNVGRGFQIAHLTGTAAYDPPPADLEAMRRFVTQGGTLIVEAGGGAGAFADAENAWLPQLLGPGVKLQALAPNDPLLKKSVDGTLDVPRQALRLSALEQLRSDGSRLKSARLGKGRVIFSGLDLSSGLLGTCTWGVLGYLPEYSDAVARNLVLTTAASRAR